MSLENLVGKSLDRIEPSQETVIRLLAAAERNIKDAQVAAVSAENRFDAAYKAVMQLGIVALHAHGFRPLTSRPGHHQTAIQTLTLTTGARSQQDDRARWASEAEEFVGLRRRDGARSRRA